MLTEYSIDDWRPPLICSKKLGLCNLKSPSYVPMIGKVKLE